MLAIDDLLDTDELQLTVTATITDAMIQAVREDMIPAISHAIELGWLARTACLSTLRSQCDCPLESEPWRRLWQLGWNYAQARIEAAHWLHRAATLEQQREQRAMQQPHAEPQGWTTTMPDETTTGNLYWLWEAGRPFPRSVFVQRCAFLGDIVVFDPKGGPRQAAQYKDAKWKGPVVP